MWSSANPEKVSRSVKWGIGALAVALGWWGLDSTLVQPLLLQAQDQVVELMVLGVKFAGDGATLVTKAGALWFLIAKIWNTFKAKSN